MPVTLGNLVGGFGFVGLALFVTFARKPPEPARTAAMAQPVGNPEDMSAAEMPFTGKQQEYLKGFMAGVEARRAVFGMPVAPGGGAIAADPNDLQRIAQDKTIAAGGKLVPEEEAKRKKPPFGRFDEMSALSKSGLFP